MRTSLEIDYSPSSMIDGIEPFINYYYAESERVRDGLPPLTLAYGDLQNQKLDYFAGPGTISDIVHVFIHGGYWQELDRRSASFPAAAFVANGYAYAAIGYTLAPAASVGDIVIEVRAACAYLYRHLRETTGRAPRFVVAGSSAGAHLAAMVALTDWKQSFGLPSDVIAGVVLLSGVFDLTPLIATYINEPLGLDQASAEAVSPLFLLGLGQTWPSVPTLVGVGEIETAAFKGQSRRFAEALATAGHQVQFLEIAGRNHFDIVCDLADARTDLGRAVSRLLPVEGDG